MLVSTGLQGIAPLLPNLDLSSARRNRYLRSPSKLEARDCSIRTLSVSGALANSSPQKGCIPGVFGSGLSNPCNIVLKACTLSSWLASLETCFFNSWKRESILAYFSFGTLLSTSLSNIPLCQILCVTGVISLKRQSSVCIIWSAVTLYLRSGLAHARTMAAFK